MGGGVLFDGDVLESHGDYFLRLQFVDHFFLLDGHVVSDVFDLVVVRGDLLHWHFDSLFHVFDVALLVWDILDATDRSHWRELSTGYGHLILQSLISTPNELCCLEQT